MPMPPNSALPTCSRKYRFAGKEKRLALGSYPQTALKAAREKAVDARKLLAAGVDPGEARKAEKAGRICLLTVSCSRSARSFVTG
jgi:hypothetical protein